MSFRNNFRQRAIAALASVRGRCVGPRLDPAGIGRSRILAGTVAGVGAEVDVVPVYRTIRPAVRRCSLTQQLRDRRGRRHCVYEFFHREELLGIVRWAGHGRTLRLRRNDCGLYRSHYRKHRERRWVYGLGYAGGKYCAGAGRCHREAFEEEVHCHHFYASWRHR